MSSTVRTLSSNVTLPLPGSVVTISYNGLPVQFSHDRNGTLDFVFSNGFTANTSISNSTTMYVKGSNNSAIRAVNKIGPNIISWLETTVGADAGSVKMHENPIVFRANVLLIRREPNSDQAMRESTEQISFEKSPGGDSNSYFKTFLFKKPMVLKYTKSGVIYYRMFTTQFTYQT